MGFSMEINIPVITVFVQGLLSFFSPCVLPLLPLYISYLSGGTAVKKEDGRMHYRRSKVMLHTLFFVIGVSFAFFILGLGVSAVGTFFKSNQAMFARIGGIVVLLFGLYQLGILGFSPALERERRLPFHLDTFAMSPFTALLLGFTFSFAWTPCVGPALTSVLLMAASAATRTAGFLLIGVYTLGFVLPFLAVGLFTTTLLELFKKYQKVVRYTVKIGGLLMVLMGILMFTGKMNSVTGYLSKLSERPQTVQNSQTEEKAAGADVSGDTDEEEGSSESEDVQENDTSEAPVREEIPAVDFTLTDQYGEEHTLEEYKGKTIFLNFWATWCHWCVTEMDDIQMLYDEYKEAGDDSVVILGIAAPDYGSEVSQEEITAFLEENGYSYPVLMDEGGNVFTSYGVYSYPTTFMFNADGNVFGYAPGMLTEEMMRSIIEQTESGVRQ